jgi:hypothetical protein
MARTLRSRRTPTGFERICEADIDDSLSSYISLDEIEWRGSRSQEKLLDHVDDRMVDIAVVLITF